MNEDFVSSHAAGTLKTYVGGPGQGDWMVLDTNAKLSTSGGALVGVTGGAANFDPSIVYQKPIRRASGVVLVVSTTVTANRVQFGWVSQPTPVLTSLNPNRRGLLDFNATVLACAQTSAGSVSVGTIALGTPYRGAIVMRLSGTQYFIKGGAYTNWTLVWTDVGIANFAAYPVYSYLGTTTAFTCDYMRCRNRQFIAVPVVSDGFGGSFGTADGLGHLEGQLSAYGAGGSGATWTQHVGSWVNSGGAAVGTISGGRAIATVNAGVTDFIASVKLTGGANAGSLVGRWTDELNYIELRHTGTNVQLVKNVAGTPTTLVNSAVAFVAGAEIRMIVEGTKVRAFYNGAAVGSEQTVADAGLASGTRVGLRTSNNSNSFDDFNIYARGTGGEYSALDAY